MTGLLLGAICAAIPIFICAAIVVFDMRGGANG